MIFKPLLEPPNLHPFLKCTPSNLKGLFQALGEREMIYIWTKFLFWCCVHWLKCNSGDPCSHTRCSSSACSNIVSEWEIHKHFIPGHSQQPGLGQSNRMDIVFWMIKYLSKLGHPGTLSCMYSYTKRNLHINRAAFKVQVMDLFLSDKNGNC